MKPVVGSSGAPDKAEEETVASSGPRSVLRIPSRFSVVRRLGGGRASEVFEALDQTTQRVVVLKLVARRGATLREASHEAEVLAALRHPGIVKLEASGVDDHVHWIATERLAGVGLDVVIREHGPLPWAFVRSTLTQVLDALEHAHQAGILHGDIKPANCFCSVFVDVQSPMSLKLLDFGLALATSEHPGAVAQGVAGSAAYLAPELAAGGQATCASDVYSVGIMAHELLLGHVPFAAGGSQGVLWQQQHGPIAPLVGRSQLAAIPESALRALDEALDKRPEQRPVSARALRERLGPNLTEVTPSLLQRLLKRPRVEARELALSRLGEDVRRIWIDDYLNETRRGFIDVRQLHRDLDTTSSGPLEFALLPHFERAGGLLLVLGEPGFGKTVAALKLCRALLDLRQRSPSWQAVPVVIPLSAWRGTAGEVFSWLASELGTRYSVNRRQCLGSLQHKRLVLVLDGLDEVPHGLRQGCVDAIDALVQSGHFAGIVVTCRTAEYHALSTPLNGLGQVELQRFDLTEIQRRVRGQGLNPLATAIETNARLAELATVPLMLRLLQGVAREESFPRWVERGPISAEGLLDRFLEVPLNTIELAGRSTDLARVAKFAVEEGQGVLRCEALQPRMLKAGWAKVSYALLGRLLVAAIACFGPLLAVAFSPFSNGQLVVTGAFAFELCAKTALISGALFGGAQLWLSSRPRSPRTSRWLNLVAALLTCAGAAAWVGFERPPAAAVMAVEASILALIALWGARPPAGSTDDVALDRELSVQRPSRRGLASAVALGVIWAVLALASTQTWEAAAYMGAAFFAAGLCLAALETRRDTIATVWNAAFWKALASAFGAAALTSAVITVCFAPAFGLAYGACVALTFAAVVFLWLGGTDALFYVLLRLHLAAEGTFPLRSRELMNRGVAARLMKRVGPGYAFVHWDLATRLLEAPRARHAP